MRRRVGARGPPVYNWEDMSILKIARMGHPVLREVARKVEVTELKSPAFQKLIDDMIETMREYEGIGLAAPQVHEKVRLALIGIDEGRGDNHSIRVLPVVNPEVKPIGSDTAEDWEGCLSLPKLRGRVVRPERIQVKALDRRGNRIDMDLEGYPARVAQHEIDHLDGILFVDRMKSFETLTFLDEYAKYLGPGLTLVSPLVIIFLTVFIDLLGFGIVIPLLPFYAERFGGSAQTVAWLAVSFSGMQFVFMPLWGRLSDRVGRRPILLLGLG